VYCISIQVTTKPRYFVGVAYMAKCFHPELFENLDTQAMHEGYMERFQGMPYQGVYVYPPLAEN
ncbi:MAG: ABC transporter substrate-binding protein, partial [ANME-2 cluster archaeon]|nr:ABC transporter substrate-binding protein [ANME-2 cluster archaeon]